ncbi:putative transposase [Trichonephila clavipes]|nr:putative transposase [Trichonephila clavipes]
MIAASPLSPDEYAMRIATQTESALICKEYSSPFIVPPLFPGTTENAFSDGQTLKVHTVQGVVQTDHHRVQSSGHGKTRYRSSSRLCRVSSDLSRCLPPVSSGLDEAHVWLNGYVNKPNCRIWSEANPQVYIERPLHPDKLTVWCALWAGGILLQKRMKATRYNGAACHTARATIDLLKDTFGDRLISRFGPVNWLPRSCDLTPLDYFLWRYVKSLVYADKPQTLDHLEDNIRRVIADIRPQMLEKVIETWTSRLDFIRASRGSPMPEIRFKM